MSEHGKAAKEQAQRAARYAKLERKATDPARREHWGDKKRDAQHAANIQRYLRDKKP